jgi:hypothetical protein
VSFGEDVAELVELSRDPVVAKAVDWPRVPLGEVAEILNGFPWKSDRFSKSGGVPLIRIRDVTTGETETFYDGPITEGYWVEPGDLLVGMDGDFNVRRWQSEKALLNQRVCKITSDPDFFDTRMLEYLLPGYLRLINQATSSVTVKHLSSRTLAELPLPFPPLAEQRRIVAKLDALTARLARARAELDRVLNLAHRLRGPYAALRIGNALATYGGRPSEDLVRWSSGKFLPKKNQRTGKIPVYGGNGVNGWHDEANVHSPTLVVGRVGAQCGNVHVTPDAAWVTDNAIFAKWISDEIDLAFALHVFRSANLIQEAAGTGLMSTKRRCAKSGFR